MKRREFLIGIGAVSLLLSGKMKASLPLAVNSTDSKFEKITAKAKAEEWHTLPMSDLMGKIALEFLGTPYAGGTLEINATEQCVINLDKLDCVTFFENVLGLARMIKLQGYDFDDLIKQVTFTRYRNGKIDGYTSRLHYTSDWIYDNVKKGTVSDITKSLGGEAIKFNVSFMSKHPQYYKPLKNNPALIKKIKAIETAINERTYYYIPKNKVRAIEDKLQTGDIIAIVNTAKGLDYSHTGLIYRENDVAHFMHASSLKKKVIIDKSISQYLLHSKKSNKGISILRPLEPRNAG